MRLSRTRWVLWNWAVLRGAGFPARRVLRLADDALVEAADRLVGAVEHEEKARGDATAALYTFAGACGPAGGHGAPPGALEKRDAAVKTKRLIERGGLASKLGFDPTVDEAIGALCAAKEALDRTRAAFEADYAAGRVRLSSRVAEIVADDRFREAVTWQNRGALQRSESRLSLRKNEELVASYLQRYCVKNDTIGFFGPVGWARLSPTGPPLTMVPGSTFLANRSVHFEHWAIDALAQVLSKDPRIEPWFAPRRLGVVSLAGNAAVGSAGDRCELSAADASLLRACEGASVARELAVRFGELFPDAFPTEAEVLESLRRLCDKGLISFSLEVPLRPGPESYLRAQLERIGDEELRASALADVSALEEARTGVSRAAGNAGELDAALGRLDEAFTRITALAPTRNAGKIYAARTLVFEDCRRAIDLSLGPALIDSAAPALSLLFSSANWLSEELALIHRREFRRLYDELSAESSREAVPFEEFWFAAQRIRFAAGGRTVDACIKELEERWSKILAVDPSARAVTYSSDALAPRVAEVFGRRRPGWKGARYQSPDLMIAASSVEAIEKGDYLLVLGELHVAKNTVDALVFLDQHPTPSELVRAVEDDMPQPRVFPVVRKDWPGITLRNRIALINPWDFWLDPGIDHPGVGAERTLRLGELVVEDQGGELRVRRATGGESLDIIEVIGETLSGIVVGCFRMMPRASHTPRVTIDRVVVARETWSFDADELSFDSNKSEPEIFVAIRRWTRDRGLPRFVFVKVAIEAKPFFVDFSSPILASHFARVVGRAKKEEEPGKRSVVVSEMVPAFDELWLKDAEGDRYTSELRIVAVEEEPR